MRLRSLGVLGALALFGTLLPVAVSAAGAAGDAATKTYVVQMLQAPVLTYEGGVAGLQATKPEGAENRPALGPGRALRRPPAARPRRVLAAFGGGGKSTTTFTRFNGVAAELTDGKPPDREAAGVVSVSLTSCESLDTSSTPAFLASPAPAGLWDQLRGPGRHWG